MQGLIGLSRAFFDLQVFQNISSQSRFVFFFHTIYIIYILNFRNPMLNWQHTDVYHCLMFIFKERQMLNE